MEEKKEKLEKVTEQSPVNQKEDETKQKKNIEKEEEIVIEDKKQAKFLKKLQSYKIKVPTLLMSIKSLAALLKAGIPLSETIETISGQSSDPKLNSIYDFVSNEVKK